MIMNLLNVFVRQVLNLQGQKLYFLIRILVIMVVCKERWRSGGMYIGNRFGSV